MLRVTAVGVGLLLTFLGVGAMIAIGPDDTLTSGDHLLSTRTHALVTSPRLLQFYGPTLRVTARSTAGKPIFIGVAGQADADSYLDNVPREVIDKVKVPRSVHSGTRDKDGTAAPVRPVGLDFWIVSASGPGQRSVSWPTANGPYEIVIMNADASPGVSTEISAGLEIAHAFVTAAVVAIIGLVLAVGGWLLLRRRSPATPSDATKSPEAPA
ncbi:MAG: hypothetical protein M3O55_02200 [Actinomycetota bacterium]|nr:hypothetical protein [Actinomycetota bacterium]